LIDRRLIDEEAQTPVMKKFYISLDSLVNKAVDEDWTGLQVIDSVVVKAGRLSDETKGATERVVADWEALVSVLSDRYDHPFNLEDLLIVQIVRKKIDPLGMLGDDKNKPLLKEDQLTGKTGSLGALNNVEKPSDYFAGTW